jgi:transcriptional regulator with XRE-family HTH domain
MIVTEKLGELLRTARLGQGWDQAQFARQLGVVGQQTVSRWERGTSSPRRAMIPRISQVLGMETQILFDAMADERPAPAPETTSPVRPLVSELPLDKLREDVFESFCTDLAELLYPYPDDVHGYGSRGDTQGGIDIEVRHPEGLSTAIQCKRVQRFGPGDVQAAVDALTLPVRECFLFLSRKASPGARQEIAKHPDWRLWDRIDISRSVRRLADQGAAIRLVDTYFPGYREAFLGVSRPGPWETAEEFFRPLTLIPVFSHGWRLAGRAQELDALMAFLRDVRRRVAVVVGAGGTGKSRLLRQFADETSRPGADRAAVRFAAADIPVMPAEFEQLPATDPLAVVVEDAHNRTDTAAIVRGVLRRNPDAKTVISVRPYARADLLNQLRNAGISPDDCVTVFLEELAPREAQQLAREALGADASPGLAEWLAGTAPDCPLIIVVGAALIKRGSLDPAHLHTTSHIRVEVMEAFRDAMIVGMSTGDPETGREVLNAVAALQPLRIDDDDFRSAMSALAQRRFDQVMPYLSSLEAAGILRRRGTSLRIVPDLLGDAVLTGASVDTVSGVPVGYLEQVYQAADGAALGNVFINASRVDWQIQQGNGGDASLVQPLWELVNAQFAQADIRGRVELVQLLKKVAAFQPRPTLELIRWALANPTQECEPSDHPLAGLYVLDYDDVRHELAPLLENIAYNLDHLTEAADLLWQLAETDPRPPNQFPYHPIRVLSRLISYAPTTPLRYHEELLATAARRFGRPDLGHLLYSPFDVLEPLLVTEAVVRSSDGLSLTLTTYPVSPGVVHGLRSQVLDLAFSELRSPDNRRAVRAARAIGSSLVYPALQCDDPALDQTAMDRWTPVFAETIERVGSLAADSGLDPVAVIALREALVWHHRYSPTKTKIIARKVWHGLPNSLDHRFALVLHDGWGKLLAETDNPSNLRQETDAMFEAVAAEAIRAWSDLELVDRLEQRLTGEHLAFDNDIRHASFFVWTLTRQRPSIADELCRRVLRDQASILVDLIPAALGRLLEADPGQGLTRACELVQTGNLAVLRNVAHTLGWGRGGRTSLADGEADLLRSLIRHEDPAVRRLTVAAGRVLGQVHPALAAELVTTVRFADSAAVADEVAAAFGAPGYLRWNDLSGSQATDLLSQLTDCPSIREYHITGLLKAICDHNPEAVVGLLIRRIEIWEQAGSPRGYEPLPRAWNNAPRFTGPQYGELLRTVHRWMTNGIESWQRRYVGSELFALVAVNFDQEALSVLQAALESGDAKQVKAAGSILSQAPRTLVWDNVDFVTKALNTALQLGDDCLQQVAGGLQAAAISGFRRGIAHQPFGEDLEQRDRATEIAARLPRGSIEQKFYRAVAESAKQSIQLTTEADDRLADRRDW